MPLFRSGEETDRGWPAPTPAASYLQMAERLDAGVPILAFCRLGSIRRATLWLRDHPHQTRQPVRRLDSLGQPRRQSAGLMRTPKTKNPPAFTWRVSLDALSRNKCLTSCRAFQRPRVALLAAPLIQSARPTITTRCANRYRAALMESMKHPQNASMNGRARWPRRSTSNVINQLIHGKPTARVMCHALHDFARVFQENALLTFFCPAASTLS
ncbi:hypothetical protein PAP18089_05097 [Pandoraea apista]|uniref:Uncharacterized protein n=1 Tax=Pandoraea apista TaxID=93218 RepID=A0A5E5PD79_9BURK|nr:hypothetical protein LMG16407_03250 [Pandoraea apista]VVG74085.1 hypothetical protein PAP18089_05097 [Pandoraea apista]